MRCKVFEPFSIKSLHLYRKQRNLNWFYNTFLTLFSIKLIRNKPFYRFLILICSPPENKDFLSRHYLVPAQNQKYFEIGWGLNIKSRKC